MAHIEEARIYGEHIVPPTVTFCRDSMKSFFRAALIDDKAVVV